MSTSWASRPGIGVRIVPWFKAASFSAFRPRSDSTSGTSADKQQRLHQPVVVAEGRPPRVVVGQRLDLFAAAVLLLQHRQQLLVVEPLGVVEVDRHVLAEGLVAVGHDVEQVAHGHHVAHLERLAVVHQELHHHLQGRPLPLEHAGYRDQRLHQGRAEGIDLAEHLAVALLGQQDVHHAVLHPRHLLEGRVEFRLAAPSLHLSTRFSAIAGRFRSSRVIVSNRPCW